MEAIGFKLFLTTTLNLGHVHASIRQAIAATVPVMEDLASIDVARREFHVRGRLLHTPRFNTPDGKASRMAVMLNPDDLAAIGRKAGDVVSLVSAHGRMDGAVLRAFDIARGSIMAYFPEADDLIGTAVDPRSKTPAFKSTPVWIEDSAA